MSSLTFGKATHNLDNFFAYKNPKEPGTDSEALRVQTLITAALNRPESKKALEALSEDVVITVTRDPAKQGRGDVVTRAKNTYQFSVIPRSDAFQSIEPSEKSTHAVKTVRSLGGAYPFTPREVAHNASRIVDFLLKEALRLNLGIDMAKRLKDIPAAFWPAVEISGTEPNGYSKLKLPASP